MWLQCSSISIAGSANGSYGINRRHSSFAQALLSRHVNLRKHFVIADVMDSGFWKGKRVLLTGHTGFKGSWLSILLLSLGSKVYGYALNPVGHLNLFDSLGLPRNGKSKTSGCGELYKDFSHHEGDINDKDSLSEYVSKVCPDICIHLAAQPLVRKSYQFPLETWQTNVIGTLNLLESIRSCMKECVVVVVTTDKVYKNNEWDFGYRENDALGGLDPYSASKSACEIAVSSWRESFAFSDGCSIAVATARAGNVLGGGDWSEDRLVPDAIKALHNLESIQLRNPNSTRPWQHVLEPLFGYLTLAERMFFDQHRFSTSFNFGPDSNANQTVSTLVHEMLKHWDGTCQQIQEKNPPHEAGKLHLNIDQAFFHLGWKPVWDFAKTVEKTVSWYKKFYGGEDAARLVMNDIEIYKKDFDMGTPCSTKLKA